MQNIYSNSSLFLVINMKMTKIGTSFWLFKIFISIITFLFVNKVFNMAQILSFILIFLENCGCIDSCCWLVSTIWLIIFVFFRDLDLKLIEINNSKVLGKLIFISILIVVLVVLISFIFLASLWLLGYLKLIFLISKNN